VSATLFCAQAGAEGSLYTARFFDEPFTGCLHSSSRYVNMNSGSVMNLRLVLAGLAIWAGATIVLRLIGQSLFHPGNVLGLVVLFLISFPAMAWVVRRLCRSAHLVREQWLKGAVSVALPTLLLDPFSSAFFSIVFPNIAPEMAGVFGGWILWCCAGALSGAIVERSGKA
jgi:hypothetical protein